MSPPKMRSGRYLRCSMYRRSLGCFPRESREEAPALARMKRYAMSVKGCWPRAPYRESIEPRMAIAYYSGALERPPNCHRDAF
ncbi:uncharacterized protein LAESUDRAFT_213280 [Laetiporus sulphureus 93-53]|uniref:Uncharacterized protein n=1 Tax=Laetiporus sulphureus 93-53 TaxID=1314785 RepID=A0A165DW45_9APHY|nr:uncharacterized protein LAESUDRAFT_213280 [Laetiporus sulphureus 93-53]KZT05749.1 hypothetical protein LAESUDRAFT_213280 [Laetiporus sulphureus 93-53]